MRKNKFFYNTQTLRYERIELSWSQKLIRIFGFFCTVVFSGFLMMLIVNEFFPSPKEVALMQEIEQLNYEYKSVLTDLKSMDSDLRKVYEKDAYAYRLIFGLDAIDQGVWEGGTGGSDKYEDYRKFVHSGQLMVDVKSRVDKLKRQLQMQARSIDDLILKAKEREEELAAIPSIKPVRSDNLAMELRLLSGFGNRIHPVFKVVKFHTGIDFTAPQGTPIQATGNGKIVSVETNKSGYGNCVVIDHGFGYISRYAHMYRIDVKVGEKVIRGQQIGLVGSTGTSTAPHCHYEIEKNGLKVNPIHYVMDGLTPEEYQELVKAAESSNQSLD
jgi:murein DD-endopeptidase MepM/ murein hydrolase activator NlpD